MRRIGAEKVAQGKLAYQLFQETFSGPRWAHLAQLGAKVQRPLWASTSTKNPAYPDTLYVDELIGPDTVNTLPDATIEAFADHGNLARRVDADVDEAEAAWQGLADVGVQLHPPMSYQYAEQTPPPPPEQAVTIAAAPPKPARKPRAKKAAAASAGAPKPAKVVEGGPRRRKPTVEGGA